MNKRKRIEQVFGWAKRVGAMRQVMVRGLAKVNQRFMLTLAAYNLTRMRHLLGATGVVRRAEGHSASKRAENSHSRVKKQRKNANNQKMNGSI
jgi:hypothetical protein